MSSSSAEKPRVRLDSLAGGRPAYQRVMGQEDQQRMEELEASLAKFDRQCSLFVHDAREAEGEVQRCEALRRLGRPRVRLTRFASSPSFTVPITAETSYDELQSLVKQQLDLPVEAEDLTLVYEGTRVRPEMTMVDLGFGDTRRRWSKPYAGVLWVVPRHIEPSFVMGDFAVKW